MPALATLHVYTYVKAVQFCIHNGAFLNYRIYKRIEKENRK